MNDTDLKDVERLRNIFEKNHESRDKALLTLCSASLGLTIAFFDKVYVGACVWLLYAVWVLLATSMLSTLHSFNTAAKTADRLEIYNHNKKKYENDVKFLSSLHLWFNVTHWLNRLSLFCFTFAVIAFIIFAILNIVEREAMSTTNNSSSKVMIDVRTPTTIINGTTPTTSMMPNNAATASVGNIEKGIPPSSSMMPSANPSSPPASNNTGGEKGVNAGSRTDSSKN